jgi:hypothetical protein
MAQAAADAFHRDEAARVDAMVQETLERFQREEAEGRVTPRVVVMRPEASFAGFQELAQYLHRMTQVAVQTRANIHVEQARSDRVLRHLEKYAPHGFAEKPTSVHLETPSSVMPSSLLPQVLISVPYEAWDAQRERNDACHHAGKALRVKRAHFECSACGAVGLRAVDLVRGEDAGLDVESVAQALDALRKHLL